MFTTLQRVWRDYLLRRSALWWYAGVLSLFVLSAISLAIWRQKLPPGTFACADIADFPRFAATLREHRDPLSDFLWNGFSDDLRARLSNQETSSSDERALLKDLVRELNAILQSNCIYSSNRFNGVKLSLVSQELLSGKLECNSLEVNRSLLQDAYANLLHSYESRWDSLSSSKTEPTSGVSSLFYQIGLVLIGFIGGVVAWESWKRCHIHCGDGLYYAIKRILCGNSLAGAPQPNGAPSKVRCNHSWRQFCDGAVAMLKDPSIARDIWSVLLFAALVTAVTTVPILFLSDKLGFIQFLENVSLNPGGLFALVTGGATLVGTIVAIQAILEVRQTITSFPQLMSRLADMIEKDTADDEVLFLAYTPLTGAWNSDPKFAKRLNDAICNHEKYVRLACLELGDGKDHERFLRQFENRQARSRYPIKGSGKIDDAVIRGYMKECDDVVQNLKGQKESPETKFKKRADFTDAIIPLADSEMPGYYFFVSSKRAIIVVPIGMPTIKHPNTANEGVVHVETLGFETTDSRIISALRQEFRRYTDAEIRKKNQEAQLQSSGGANINKSP